MHRQLLLFHLQLLRFCLNFHDYEKLLAYCKKEAPSNKHSIVGSKVELAYQLQICEYIAVINSLLISTSASFDKNSFDLSLGDEALTGVASLRLGLLTRIRNEIRKS